VNKKAEEITFAVRGEWDDEPHEESFVHAELPCMIRRNSAIGHLCGYVGVPPSHPFYRKGYDELYNQMGVDIDVHGGLTFAHLGGHREVYCESEKPACYDRAMKSYGDLTPEEMTEMSEYLIATTRVERWEPDEEDRWQEGFWWFGYDTAHFGDYGPPTNPAVARIMSDHPRSDETYKNWAYVKKETEHLAEQLAAAVEMPTYQDWLKKQNGKDKLDAEA